MVVIVTQNSKTASETKHKNFKCEKIKNSNCDKTKKEIVIMTSFSKKTP